VTTVSECYERWLNLNLNGVGKSTGKSSVHFYRDNVYFYNGLPVQRIFDRGVGRKSVLAIKNSVVYVPKFYKDAVELIGVEDLGVFSMYPNDFLKDDKAHERQRFIMLSCIREFVDETVPGYTDELASEGNSLGAVTRTISNYYEKYEHYAELFGLDWPKLPESYRERVIDTIYRKRDAWSDPKNVAKRERAQAKRLANKALGLD
jgi:hypothetical protein